MYTAKRQSFERARRSVTGYPVLPGEIAKGRARSRAQHLHQSLGTKRIKAKTMVFSPHDLLRPMFFNALNHALNHDFFIER